MDHGSKELEMAIKAAREAGAVLMQKFGHLKGFEYKGAVNLVTEADRASEEIICRILEEHFPSYSILSEERGSVVHGSGCAASGAASRWIVDPLDGTTNFVHGLPNFSVSIALERNGKIQAGVVYNPPTDELFTAEADRGAYLNGREIHVTAKDKLIECLLATGFSYDMEARKANLVHVANFVPRARDLRRFGSAALDCSLVACGRLDGFWEASLGAWDVAAGSLLVREAGGRVTDFDGGPFDVDKGRLVASNGKVHQAMLDILKMDSAGFWEPAPK